VEQLDERVRIARDGCVVRQLNRIGIHHTSDRKSAERRALAAALTATEREAGQAATAPCRVRARAAPR
jgi:hypothetical protein